MEEVSTDVINLTADILIAKDKSEWQMAIDAYVKAGKTEGEAFGLALADQAAAMGLDFLGGAISGGVMSSGGVAINRISNQVQYSGLVNKIKGFVDKLARKIRWYYGRRNPDSFEGRMVGQMTDAIGEIQDKFAEALVEASENYQAAEKNTTDEGGEDHAAAAKRSDRIVDQMRSSLHQIMEMDSVYTIDASNATPYTTDWGTDEKSGHEVFKAQGGVANRPGFGIVILGKKGAVSTVFHGNGPAKQAAFPAIKSVIEQGIEIGRDYNHNGKGFDTVTFAAPVNFFGTKAPLGVVVKVSVNGRGDKSFYIHEICDAEGNYIQLEDGVLSKKEISSTGLVDHSSTADAADDGISPKTSIRNERGIVNNEFVKEYKDRHKNAICSDRATDSVSNRSLLANAFEDLVQNDIERKRLQEYKDKIGLINAEEQKLRKLNEQIKELSFAKGPRDTKAIRDLQDEAKKTANRINIYDTQLLRLEASKPLQNVLEREKKKAYQRAEKKGKEALEAYREKAVKTQREMLDRWQESRKKGVESRHKTAMRHKIQNVVKELNDLLLNESKKRHVPDSLKKAVAAALDLVNMDTVGAEQRAAKYAELIAKETDQDKIDAYTVTMENILRKGEKMGQRLKELHDAYTGDGAWHCAGCLDELGQCHG